MHLLFDFDITTIILMGIIALVFHMVWGWLSIKLNPLFILAAVFLLVSPLSIAGSWFVGGWKIARLYSTLMMVLIGLYIIRHTGLGPASKAFLCFCGFYTLAALWSDYASKGLLYKGMFFMVACAGVLLGNSLFSFRGLMIAMRVLLPTCIVWGIMIWFDIITHPGRIGRLEAYHMNANSIAASSAFNAIVCAYIMLYDTSKMWKTLAYVVGVTMALIIPFTGSRGGLGTAVLACSFVFLPVVKRPGRLLGFAVLIAVTGIVTSHFFEADAASRLTSMEFTRGGVWARAMELFSDSPIIGQGWVFDYVVRGEATTSNLHSIYMNVLAETGLVGMALMIGCFTFIFVKARQSHRMSVHYAGYTPPIYLAVGLLIANLAGGAFEIGPMVGSTINGLFFGFSIGLIDAIPRMTMNYQYEMAALYGQTSDAEGSTDLATVPEGFEPYAPSGPWQPHTY